MDTTATHPGDECEAGFGDAGKTSDWNSEFTNTPSSQQPTSAPPITPRHRALLAPLLREGRVHAIFRAHEVYVFDELRRLEIAHGLTIHRSWNPELGQLEFELDAIERFKVAELIGDRPG